ncbi:MAG: MATE family efflux transporter [Clostridia bacterium]|nr:MATE family efflux transporter [Clostridia bacterium]
MASRRAVDLTKGPVFKQLVAFLIPIFITALMQQLYHAADVFVVGNFAGTPEECKIALAAVGATGSVTSLLLNAVSGISIGSNVVSAHAYGNRDKERALHVISTSLIFAFLSGTLLAAVGYFASPTLLKMIKVPLEIRDQALAYMRIIFLGQPASMLFNFCSSIFRSRGNTRISMNILTVTGIVNVVLNLVFVIVFDLDSAGVAIATVIASVLSAVVALMVVFHPQGDYRLSLSDLRVHKNELFEILKIGVPAGLNSVLFQFSNTIVATAANSLGTVTVAAVSAANSVNNVAHTFGGSLSSAAISFSAQNCGAGKLRRVDEYLVKAGILGTAVFLGINTVLTLFPHFFLGLFSSSPEVVQAGVSKLMISSWGYMLYLLAEQINGCQRGFGKSVFPTALNIFCVCFLRIAWVWWVFPAVPAAAALSTKILWLYLCLPVSWAATLVAQCVNYFGVVRGKEWRRQAEAGTLAPEDMAYYMKKQKNHRTRRKGLEIQE